MDRPLQLHYPVMTLDDEELLPSNTILTTETMESLIRSVKNRPFATRPLWTFGTIAVDLERICSNPPYDQIFSDSLRKREVFEYLQQVKLVKPLLGIYDYFKTRDPYTYRHILTVFALSLLLSQDLIENRSELSMEVLSASNHDLGKICVPTAVLKKTTPLSEQERQQLTHHVAAGYVLLSYYLQDPYHPAAITARDHHERRDGSGYPCGIKLSNPIVEIVGAVDVFDALITRRPYRTHSYDLRTALETLSQQADQGVLNKDIVHALIRLNRKNPRVPDDCQFSKELRGTPPPGNQYSGALHLSLNKNAK
jgi:HD-GYP domain-containing protein (c-di-GMP phosphodiesterase class II)